VLSTKRLSAFWITAWLVCLLTVPAGADCGRALKIGVFDWRPETSDYKASPAFAGDQAMWQAVFDRAGCDVKWQVMPAHGLIHLVETGAIDGAIPASKTAAREAFARFSKPYKTEELVGFILRERAGRIGIRSVADIRDAQLRLALAYGSWYGAEIDHLLKTDPIFRDKVNFSDDAAVMLRWLLTGHVDMLLSWRSVAERLLARRGILGTEVVAHDAVLYKETSHLMLGKAVVPAETAARLDAALAAHMQSDAYAAFLAEN
jgi:polar amino acid transport system substrate-binding protein